VRLSRLSRFFRLLLLCLAAGALHAAVTITLGASSGATSGCALQAGQTCTLTARVTGQISTAAVTWSFSPPVAGATTGAGTAPDGTGLSSNTYRAPSTIVSSITVTVTATSVEDNQASASAQITLQPVTTPPTAVTVTVSPSTVSLTNGQTQQFSATVLNSSNTGVIWSISPQSGTIDRTGLYTAPAFITGNSKVVVTATSAADATKSGTASITLGNLVDVGVGAPNDAVQRQFLSSFFRNGFANLVTLPPVGNVKRLGTTGYVQEFNDAKNPGVKLALATASATAPVNSEGNAVGVVQLLGDLYAAYTAVGANTAGLPLYDTLFCPVIDGSNSCTYDIFDKGYALFAYRTPLATGQDFTIRQLFYTEWTNKLGIAGLGRPVDVETAITASTANTATEQTFINGAIYAVTSGVNKGQVYTVSVPIFGLYVTTGGPTGSLGLPVGQEITLASGVHRQLFEGGTLEYTPGGSGPILRLPVTSVVLTGVGTTVTLGATISLNLGDVLTLTATPISSLGDPLPDRPLSWSTTNSRVITIQANNRTAVLRAVGGGVASVTAASEGVVSQKLNLIVIAPCCQVGDGAPPAIQLSFQDALTRNGISVRTPVPSPASRVGNGYIQVVQSDAATPATWLVAKSDRIGTAFLVGGAVLDRYRELGGPGGALGYPASDQSAGCTQRFENGAALAGSPVRLVSGALLTKWTLLGSETGAAGPPLSDTSPFSTFGANTGVGQGFQNGAIYAATAGPRLGQAYFVAGLILARYQTLGGPGGDYGMPVSDEFITGGVHQQNFEGGNFTWSPGDAAATDHAAAKTPGVIVSPTSAVAGSRARLAIVGFPNNSAIRVSVSGQPDFTVNTASGAYSWEMFVPLSAKSGTVAIHAADTRGAAAADGSLAIKGFADNRIPFAKVQGDNQTGVPGALLPLALRIALRDPSGDPVVGVAVTFEASSGALLSTPSAVTDAAGLAETLVRLPSAEGIALVRADAPSVASAPVTFGVRAAASSLANFPKLQQAGDVPLGNGIRTIAQKGALLTAVASILRYHQNRGELTSPNGTADPATLNRFLKGYCPADAAGKQNCDGFLSNPDSGEQVVNLWRAVEFTGGADVDVAQPTQTAIADLVAQGSPVLLSLALSLNGTVAGGHFVVATGVAADGSIVIQDPSPFFARTSLNDYITGFNLNNTNNTAWKAELRGVARLALRSPGPNRFLVAALSQPASLMKSLALDVTSAAGACAAPLEIPDAVNASVDATKLEVAMAPNVSRVAVCDGGQAVYQIIVGPSVGTAQPYRALVTDLAPGGSSIDVSGSQPATYKATRPQLNLSLAPQDVSFTAAGIVNGATFTAGIAPGGVVSIFGSGLSGPGRSTTVDFDGSPARVIAATPFQINAEVPGGISPGAHTVRVQSAFGTGQQAVTVSAVAPAIFLVGSPPAGALVNPNASLNGPSRPIARGALLLVYATGLGAVTQRGQLSVTNATVTAVLNGTELPVAFAGLAPGYVGLYQVNVPIPSGVPPGLGIPITLKVGGQQSNMATVSVQ
jgi:uncharacterized protein (TIGR03437 family)